MCLSVVDSSVSTDAGASFSHHRSLCEKGEGSETKAVTNESHPCLSYWGNQFPLEITGEPVENNIPPASEKHSHGDGHETKTYVPSCAFFLFKR